MAEFAEKPCAGYVYVWFIEQRVNAKSPFCYPSLEILIQS